MQKAEINELNTKAKELLKTEVTGISYSTWISNIENLLGGWIKICQKV